MSPLNVKDHQILNDAGARSAAAEKPTPKIVFVKMRKKYDGDIEAQNQIDGYDPNSEQSRNLNTMIEKMFRR
jgi:hypothetical protein